ncbi:hypothetical protein [Mesorhizobium sp. STM 4661]|uniref:hypothetical protein n=1 Tax=Mesorhizobium sp. STM 4661 TaxID=1297570 RepID=UPI0002BE765F|nr:hypothetical protein [Mesorhizobium sp. STM 4661]CCV11617.1 hypothetical protein MESS4_330166 [Mesorhizobium sp. STM 4661]
MLVVSALLRSDQALIAALVDDLGTDFGFTSDMAHIGADMRRSLTGRIGAALCHLYLDQLGYAWLDYADQYISPRRWPTSSTTARTLNRQAWHWPKRRAQ